MTAHGTTASATLPAADGFADLVEAFCLQQAELRARLAIAGGAANPLTDQRNGNRVTDNGGHGDGQT